MGAYEHTITIYDREGILSNVASGAPPPSVVFCDTEGVCFFDETPNPYMKAVIDLLDEMGEDGWELVQVIPREQDLICFWRRASGAEEGQ
jgi:hypothetical protein